MVIPTMATSLFQRRGSLEQRAGLCGPDAEQRFEEQLDVAPPILCCVPVGCEGGRGGQRAGGEAGIDVRLSTIGVRLR